jgi:hypothetical protein
MKAPIERLLDQVEFKYVVDIKTQTGLPFVTHEGILKLGDIEITVCQLSTGARIIPESELEKLFPNFKEILQDYSPEKETQF